MNGDPATGEPIINLRGQRVGLGPLEPTMLADFTRWINDFETVRTLGLDPRPMTRAEEQQWLSRIRGPSEVVFAIFDLEDMAAVGSTNLFNINHRHQTCEIGIAILDPARRGKGLGTEAVSLIADYAIHGLEMHNVQVATYEFNWAGQAAYAKAGFREYGRRRKARLHNGQWWDVIYMDVLAPEWQSPVMDTLMTPVEER